MVPSLACVQTAVLVACAVGARHVEPVLHGKVRPPMLPPLSYRLDARLHRHERGLVAFEFRAQCAQLPVVGGLERHAPSSAERRDCSDWIVASIAAMIAVCASPSALPSLS